MNPNKVKSCYKCNITKNLENYTKYKRSKDGYFHTCKLCMKEKRALNSDKIKENNKKQYQKDKKNRIRKAKNYYKENKEKVLNRLKGYYLENKDVKLNYNKDYYSKNSEKLKLDSKLYRSDENNKPKINKNKREYVNKKVKNNNLFRLTKNVRCLITNGIKNTGYSKNSKTAKILDCSFEFFKQYIESKFESWMTWDNYGKYKKNTYNFGWDLDHIIPMDSAKTEEDIIRLSHYTNFQPLCSKINRDIKRNKI